MRDQQAVTQAYKAEKILSQQTVILPADRLAWAGLTLACFVYGPTNHQMSKHITARE